jgi:hypothetical protein
MRVKAIMISLISAIPMLVVAPSAHADDTVTYEVLSISDISIVNVEYSDVAGRHIVEHVPLPWRMNATVTDPRSNNAQVRADWRPVAKPSKWITVRVFYRGSLLCQSTLDVGNASCYGSTTFKS